jgi:hypothetical protein
MPRQFNYTHRKRITRDDARVRITRNGNGGLVFDVTLQLGEYKFDSSANSARVFVEAYRGATASWKRFDFGTVTDIVPPEDRALDEFEVPEGVLFRIRVTASGGESDGLLVGEADAIQPLLPGQADDHVQPLIQHMPSDGIGDELWRIDFNGDMPLILINSRLAIGVDQFLMDSRYRAVFSSAVMRQVLTRILLIEKDSGDEDDDSDWRQRWVRFGVKMAGAACPDEGEDIQEFETWIDQAVEAFSARMGFLKAFDMEVMS